MANKADYCEYFGFDDDPFSIAPNPYLLYPSDQHKQALAHLKYGLDREGGFILLTGEVGTGKTTLTRFFLQQLASNVRVAFILNARLSSADLVYSICRELDVEIPEQARGRSSDCIEYLNQDLLKSHSQSKKTLLVIEEAQHLSPEVLETLRLLTNLETNTTKLLHIMLVAQPELLQTLAQENLRQLNQRVVSRHHLLPLTYPEIESYINYRVTKVAGEPNLFSKNSLKRLYIHSGGIPRLLNLLAERSLLAIYARGQKQVSAKIVDTANQEVLGNSQKTARRMNFSRAAIFLIAVTGIALISYFSPNNRFELNSKQSIEGNKPSPVMPKLGVTAVANASFSEFDEKDRRVSRADAAQQLFNLWKPNVVHEVSIDNLCNQTSIESLQCESLDDMTIADLLRIDIPGLVTLSSNDDVLQRYLLRSITNSDVVISNASSKRTLSLTEFMEKWQGDYLILWRAPVGYSHALYPGAENSTMVKWLLSELQKPFPEVEHIITGGHYSNVLSGYVRRFQSEHGLKPDGILGIQTIIALRGSYAGKPSLQMTDIESH